ncbi:MAG: response regulator [Desulfomonile tiedjei]|nr:response regulator [Desulfomonile tiedjei]
MARILVMEDDPATRDLLEVILLTAGHEVIAASDGEQGVELYCAHPTDLVIADMLMPKKPGWEAILDLWRKFPDLKAIGISAGDDQGPFGYLMMARRFGAKRVLAKPFSKRDLLDAVRDVLSGSAREASRKGRPVRTSPEKRSILLVDGDTRHSWDLCTGLAKAGHVVTDIQTLSGAVNAVKNRGFEVAILDVPTIQGRDLELFAMLRRGWNRPLIIAMADFNTLVVKKLVTSRGADHFISKPVDLDELLDLMFPPSGFEGRLDGFDILEYLQFILLTGKKTVVEVRASKGRSCKLYCMDGDIVHATSDTLAGEEAFFQSVGFQGGVLTSQPWEAPERRTINRRGEYLLIEAARRRDDRQR